MEQIQTALDVQEIPVSEIITSVRQTPVTVQAFADEAARWWDILTGLNARKARMIAERDHAMNTWQTGLAVMQELTDIYAPGCGAENCPGLYDCDECYGQSSEFYESERIGISNLDNHLTRTQHLNRDLAELGPKIHKVKVNYNFYGSYHRAVFNNARANAAA